MPIPKEMRAEIKCKYCKKIFSIYNSGLKTRKYCSRKCGQDDNWGFKPRNKDCVICKEEFTIETQLQMQKKTCSSECHYELTKQISYKRSREKKIKKCKICGAEFEGRVRYLGLNKCKDCLYRELSKKRIGKNNPNYKDGHATKKKFGGRRSIYTARHFAACRKYRIAMIKKYGYVFCEICVISSAFFYEVHHIYFASQYPKHKQLHNFANLIMLCKQCHGDMHASKLKEKFLEIEKKRDLKNLFKKSI